MHTTDFIRRRPDRASRIASAKTLRVGKSSESDDPLVLILYPTRCPAATDDELRQFPPIFLSRVAAMLAAPQMVRQIQAHRGPIAKYSPALIRHLRRGLS